MVGIVMFAYNHKEFCIEARKAYRKGSELSADAMSIKYLYRNLTWFARSNYISYEHIECSIIPWLYIVFITYLSLYTNLTIR